MTPLLWAAQGGHWQCIEKLCENFSDLDVCDKNVTSFLATGSRPYPLPLRRYSSPVPFLS